MILATAMNDTDLGSIRRSIFFYASFIVFVWWYELSINPSGNLFGFFSFPPNVKINSLTLASLAGLIQVYLIVRLIVTRPIALATLHQAWGMDELAKNDEFVDTINSIQEMVKNSASVSYPSKELGDLKVSELQEIASEVTGYLQEKRSLEDQLVTPTSLLKQIQQTLSEYNQSYQSILKDLKENAPVLEQRLMELSFEKENLARDEEGKVIVGAVKPSVAPDAFSFLRDLQALFSSQQAKDLKKAQEENFGFVKKFHDALSALSEKLQKNNEHLAYCVNFPDAFQETELGQLINSMKSDLLRMRSRRETEFKVFEVFLPLCFAGASLLIIAVMIWNSVCIEGCLHLISSKV